MSGKDPKTPLPSTEPMSQLKEQIATRAYHVDSRAVAREMLFKMRMMALVREAQRRSWSNPNGFRSDPSD
jgi:hypothetical protein